MLRLFFCIVQFRLLCWACMVSEKQLRGYARPPKLALFFIAWIGMELCCFLRWREWSDTCAGYVRRVTCNQWECSSCELHEWFDYFRSSVFVSPVFDIGKLMCEKHSSHSSPNVALIWSPMMSLIVGSDARDEVTLNSIANIVSTSLLIISRWSASCVTIHETQCFQSRKRLWFWVGHVVTNNS